MITSTSRLFRRLLRTLAIETVCDVGSMDGSDALSFRRELPEADILALEPNPRNFELMKADQELHRQSIRVFPLAASVRSSQAPFFLVTADYTEPDYRRGMSSLYRRADDDLLAEVVQVRTIRLDDLLASESLSRSRIALWLDTEGMAFEAILGASNVLPNTAMIHVEVETIAVIGREQKVFAQVEGALRSHGFTLWATDQRPDCLQFNALFIRAETLYAKRAAIRYWTLVVHLHRLVARRLVRILPSRPYRALAKLIH